MPAIPFPIALAIVGAIYWPVPFVLGVGFTGLGAFLRGGWRVLCFIVAVLLFADAALALWLPPD